MVLVKICMKNLAAMDAAIPDNTPLLTKFRYNYNRSKVENRLKKIIKLLKENGYSFKTFRQI